MIAVSSENGFLLRLLPQNTDDTFGFHRLFGFVSEATCRDRLRNRKLHGLPNEASWLCKFQIKANEKNWKILPSENCKAVAVDGGAWKLTTAFGEFLLSENSASASVMVAPTVEEDKNTTALWAAILALLFVALFVLMPRGNQEELVAPIIDPIEVKVPPQVQKAVRVPTPDALQVPDALAKQKTIDRAAKQAVAQNLGFLGYAGKKDLTKAIGGMPTSLANASPGAGPGGLEGSGGEMVVGLGKGVKRTTVGNSGVAGLGGIGTKGAGGGAGGYGTSMVGSGSAGRISAMPLSSDIVMEGGLDRAVIQATIAKYISQVRACYEEGLRKNPGLMGTVTMAFEVNAGGDLNYSRVGKSTLGNSEVEGCIGTRMMTWKFPKPLGGVNVKVNYPFLLRPVNT